MYSHILSRLSSNIYERAQDCKYEGKSRYLVDSISTINAFQETLLAEVCIYKYDTIPYVCW